MTARTTGSTVGLAALLLVTGCTAAKPSPDSVGGPCPTDKLKFTRETGCWNDGSVEFCVPKDAAVEKRVWQVAPNIEARGGAGRVHCDLEVETLYFLRLDECTGHQAELTDESWERICAIARLPEIELIVPTRFE